MTKATHVIFLRDLDFKINDRKKSFRSVFNEIKVFMEDGSDTQNLKMSETLLQLNRLYVEIKAFENLRLDVVSLQVMDK